MRITPWLPAIAALGGLNALLLGLVPAVGEGEEGTTRVSIVSTASADGELEDCGCKKNPMGGIARRGPFLDETRAGSDVTVLVDAGNWAEDDGFEPLERSEFIWDLMARYKYDVVTPGDRELLWGRQGTLDLYARHPEIQVVSANITDKSGKQIWSDYTVIDRGGVKIAVTGITAASGYDFNVSRGLQRSDDFVFQDTRVALERVIPKMRAEADLVVVLYHDLPAAVTAAASEIRGMDVVVTGHNPGYTEKPDNLGGTLVVRGGNRGMYLPVTTFTLDPEKLVEAYETNVIPLKIELAPDPAMDLDVTRWLADYRRREQSSVKQETIAKALETGSETFLGADTCARCHADEYTSWAEGVHAAALRKDHSHDPESVAKGVDIGNVQCEHCHGLGTYHGTPGMETKVAEATCNGCHLAEGAPKVDYAGALSSGAYHR